MAFGVILAIVMSLGYAMYTLHIYFESKLVERSDHFAVEEEDDFAIIPSPT